MKRLSIVIWLLVIVVASFLLYMVKYQVQGVKNQIAEASRQLEQEKESLHVAAAEWAYLNRPERLEQLARKYLAATDLTVDQVADIDTIPFPDQMQAMAKEDEDITPASVSMRKPAGAPR